MVDFHASQCGFCTPGIVMSLFALYHQREAATYAGVCDALAGNLCRCTGYRPILDAALATCDGRPADRFAAAPTSAPRRSPRSPTGAISSSATTTPSSPRRRARRRLAELYARHPRAVLLAGATDVGLWITKRMLDLKQIIWLGRVAGLDAIEDGADALRIGAGATLHHADAASRRAPSRPRRVDARASARARCARAARSAAISPTARRSAISRRR